MHNKGFSLLLVVLVMLAKSDVRASPVVIKAPLVCSRGSGENFYNGKVDVPFATPASSTFSVRIDSMPSGVISHGGLNYLHDMSTDYLVPIGTTYVDGTARIVPDTGTQNVRPGARVWHEAGTIHYLLPAHVDNGSSYTPPSITFDLKVTANPGTVLALKLHHVEVKASVIVLGDLTTICDPNPKPYTIGVTLVDPTAR